jgi:DNA-binding HxlR family transcriptional regulator
VRWQDVAKLDCTIARTAAVIGDRWTLLVLRDAFLGMRRFDQFQTDLGITRHRLADRLARLVKHGVLRRERYQDRPPRFEYRLTEKGLELYGVIVTIADWGDRHMAGKKGPPVERVQPQLRAYDPAPADLRALRRTRWVPATCTSDPDVPSEKRAEVS